MFVIFKSIILVTAWLNESDDGCMAERGNASLQNSANGCGTPVMGVHSGCSHTPAARGVAGANLLHESHRTAEAQIAEGVALARRNELTEATKNLNW